MQRVFVNINLQMTLIYMCYDMFGYEIFKCNSYLFLSLRIRYHTRRHFQFVCPEEIILREQHQMFFSICQSRHRQQFANNLQYQLFQHSPVFFQHTYKMRTLLMNGLIPLRSSRHNFCYCSLDHLIESDCTFKSFFSFV